MFARSRYFRNKTVCVTGAASGLGQETVRQLAERKVRAIGLLDLNSCDETLAKIDGAAVETHVAAVDTTDIAAVKDAFATCAAAVGAPDLVIHCAGIATSRRFVDTPAESFEKILRVNVFGTRNVAETAYPYLKAKSGGLLIFASLAGILPNYGYSAYGASKFATVGLSEILRHEWRPDGIRVCQACPPEVPTPLVEKEREEISEVALKLKLVPGVVKLKPAVRSILNGFAANRAIIMPGLMANLAAFGRRLAPGVGRWVTDTIIRATLKTKA